MTLSPPVRVAALAAALVLTGIGAVVFILGGRLQGETATPAAPATRPAPRASASTPTQARTHKPAVASKRSVALRQDLPVPVAKALLHRKVVVIAVYVPGASVDGLVRSEARAGARMSLAGFVPISASSEVALQKIVAKTGVLPAPAVVILRRPGVVATTLGVVDRETVAAAVAQAKSRR